MTNSKIINNEQIKSILNLDKSRTSLKKFIDIFNASVPEEIKKLQTFVKEKDLEQVARLIHNLKTTCGYVGAFKMTETCLVIESQFEKVSQKKLEQFAEDLKFQFQEAQKELRKIANEL